MYAAIKRLMDILGALLGLALLAPLLLVVALSVRLKLGSPVLFTQVRPGLKGKPFLIRKFRTMSAETGKDGRLLPDEARITPLGRWLRQTSIDELPELLNVLKGDMSLVGPRPLLMEYIPHYSPRQSRRHDVRPGITGWAQVRGRNAITWEQKFEHDVWYVEHMSLVLDLKILLLTLRTVIRMEGINEPGHATASPFRGKTD